MAQDLALSLVNGDFDKLLVTTSYANSDGTVDMGDFSFNRLGPEKLKVASFMSFCHCSQTPLVTAGLMCVVPPRISLFSWDYIAMGLP